MNKAHESLKRVAYTVFALSLLAAGCGDSDAPPPTGIGPDTLDTTAPQPVTDLAAAYPTEGGDVILTWTAPQDDDATQPVARYEIRYSYSFPLNWDLSQSVPDPPEPSPPGTPETYAIETPNRGRDLYAAVRCYDAAGNSSTISGVAHVRVTGLQFQAVCVDALTGQPVEDLDVVLTERHIHELTTDLGGAFTLSDLTAGTVNVFIRSTAPDARYHHINHAFELRNDLTLTYHLIRYEPTTINYDNVLQIFIDGAMSLSALNSEFRKWKRVPVDTYVPDFVNGSGVDYGQACRDAFNRWEEKAGVDLFEFVPEPPDTGIVVHYKTREEMNGRLGITTHENTADGYPLLSEVSVVDDYPVTPSVYKTFLHEAGHTIRIDHLPSGYLMYAGQPLPNDITDDEAKMVRLHTALPNGIDTSVYDTDTPE